MRKWFAALPLFALAACGGGGTDAQTAGSIAPPTGGTGTGTGGGSGGGIGGGTGGTATPTPTPAHFLDVGTTTSFQAVGGLHSLNVTETGVEGVEGPRLYAGNAATVRAPSGEISYNPRDGIFTVTLADTAANVNLTNYRFQDPAHRTDYGGVANPQWGTPTNLTDFNYLEGVGPSSSPERIDAVTFFYQRPGSQTKYVSLAGYVRNAFNPTGNPLANALNSESVFERGAFVFGESTGRTQIPLTGQATFSGGMLATMVSNTSLDTARFPTYFQWITGTSELKFDFAAATMSVLMNGTVSAANYGGQIIDNSFVGVASGSTFKAEGTGKIDLTKTGGFTGNFVTAAFTQPNGTVVRPDFAGVNGSTSTAGANSIDGSFYGPNAVNVGGGFRVIGGIPDQRVDILGAFTGAKK